MMIDLDSYIPGPDATADDTTTWDEHYTGDYEPPLPECSSHYTYRKTVSVERFQIWVCPHCGRFSDTYAPHSGGTHLTAPTSIDTDRVLQVVGKAYIPPSNGSPGDGTIYASLVATPFEARNDIKAFKSDVDWRPSVQGRKHYRRWVEEWSVWAIQPIGEFIDHLAARDWIVINQPGISPNDD